MTQYLKDLIWDECNKANRFLHIPGIYRHFKQTKENEDMIYAVSNISVPIIDEDVADDFRVIGINPIGFTIKENTEDFDSMMNQVNKAFVEIEENKHITKSMLDNLTTKKRLVRNTYGDYSSANISYGHEKDLSVFQLRRMRLANRKKEFLFAYKAFNEELEAVKSKINKIQSALEKQ